MRKSRKILIFMLSALMLYGSFPTVKLQAADENQVPVQNLQEVFYSPVKVNAPERYLLPDNTVATRTKFFNVIDAKETILNDYAAMPSDSRPGIMSYLKSNDYSAKFIMHASGGYRYNYNATGTIPDVIDCTQKYNFGANYISNFSEIPALSKAAHKGDLQFAAPLHMYSLYEKHGQNDEAMFICTGMSGAFRLYQTGRWVPFNWDGKYINTFYPFKDDFYVYYHTTGESDSFNRAAFTNMEIYLKDMVGPKIESVGYSTRDPLSENPGFTNKFNLTSQYAYISLNFDEHVKFRDSFATESNLENLKSLKLHLPTIIDGIAGGAPIEASFYKLAPSTDGNFTRMIFKYEIPQNQEFSIQSVVIDAASNNDLLQNITDLAGNAFGMPKGSSAYLPVTQTFNLSTPIYIDTIRPTLGSPDISSDIGTLKRYANLTLTVNFSEIMKVVGSEEQNADNKAIVYDYTGIKNIGVITNMFYADGTPIVLNSSNAYRISVLQNKKVGSLNGREVTSITCQFLVPEGAYITDDYVKVIGLQQYKNGELLSSVTLEDMVDNPIDLTKSIQAPNNQFVLDTHAPDVNAQGPLNYSNNTVIDGKNNAQKEFYFKVTVDDITAGKKSSTVNGQTGTLYLGLLKNYTNLTQDTYQYQVTDKADKPSSGNFKTVPNGSYISFPEDKTTYIHIKLKDSVDTENLDIRTCAYDQAGNEAKTNILHGDNIHKYVLDSVPPDVSIVDKGVVTENGVKKFYARFSAADDRGNMKAYGIWQDASISISPTDWSSATVITATYAPLLIVDRFTLNLADGQQYAKTLWIKVTDLQNTSVLPVTGFDLDLRTPVLNVQPVISQDKYMTGIPRATVTSDVYNSTLYYQWIINDKISGDYPDNHPDWNYSFDSYQNGGYQHIADYWKSVPISNSTGPVTLTLEDPLICYSGWWFKASDYRDPSRFPYDTEILLYVRSGTLNKPDRISITRFKVINSADPYGTVMVLGQDHAMKPILPKLKIADSSKSVVDFTYGYNGEGYVDILKNIYGIDMIDFDSNETFFEVAKVDVGKGGAVETSIYKEKLSKLEVTNDPQETAGLDDWWYVRYKFSYPLPASLFTQDRTMNNYLFRLSIKPKKSTNIDTGAPVSYPAIVYTVTNVIADSHNADNGSIVSVKNNRSDTEMLREYDYGTSPEDMYIGSENPAITFRTLSGFFEGQLDSRSGMVSGTGMESPVPHVAVRLIANPANIDPNIMPGEEVFTNSNIQWADMTANKDISDGKTTANYKYFDFTTNNSAASDLQLHQGENYLYYQFSGATGVKSKISRVIIHVESTPPQIYFNATPKPNDNIPEFTTKEPVVAYVDYVIDSHIDENLQKEITDTSPSLIKVETQGILDDGTVLTASSDGKYAFASNGKIIATATDRSGNKTTKEFRVSWIDIQKPVITASAANTDAPISITASASDDNNSGLKLYAAFDSIYEEYLNGKDSEAIDDSNRSWFEITENSLLPGIISASRIAGSNEVSFSLKAYTKYDVNNSVTPKSIYLKAVDYAGNVSDIKTVPISTANIKPDIVSHGYTDTNGYTLDFNMPVKLQNLISWANGAVQATHDNVNIYTDGEYTIQYSDIFNQSFSTRITANIFGQMYAHSVTLSDSRPTKEPVTLTISTEKDSGLYIRIADTVGNNSNAVAKEDTVEINGELLCSTAKITFTDNDEAPYTLVSTKAGIIPKAAVYKVVNIDKTAPTAQVTRKVNSYEYTNNGKNVVVGTVQYDIKGFDESNVSMLSDSGTSYTFSDKGSYTFIFKDEAGNENSVTVTEDSDFISPSVANDTTAPEYILIYNASNENGPIEIGRYDKDFYEDLIKKNQLVLPYVSGDVIVNVLPKDDNVVTMVLLDGGSFAGRVAGQDKLVFTGNGTAKVQLEDSKGNITPIDIKVSCIDKEAPGGTVRYIIQTDKTVRAYLESIEDNMSSADECQILNMDDVKYDSELNEYYLMFTGNGSGSFQVMDEAGNIGNVAAVVASIDLAKPDTASVKWNPAQANDESKPMTGIFTNSNVKAFFTLSERVKSANVKVVNPQGVADADTGDYVVYSLNETSLTLEFKKNAQVSLTLTDFAGNVSDIIMVPADGILTIIDKEAPVIQASSDYAGTAKVGSVKYSFVSNEDVCITSERNVDSLGNTLYFKSFDKVYTQNGTYTLTFADKAGNVTAKTITIDQIDTEGPKLKLSFVKQDDLSGSTRTNKAVQVRISADENCSVQMGGKNGIDTVSANYVAPNELLYTIENNGVFEITATDSFGNKSVGNLRIDFIDKNPPVISMSKNGAYEVAANSSDYNSVLSELKQGVTASDAEDGVINPESITVTGFDESTLKTPDTYTIRYSVKDSAGNEGTSSRELIVYDTDTSFFTINGERMGSGGVKIIGQKTINIVSPAVEGDYVMYYKKGWNTVAMMKNDTALFHEGTFEVDSTGYYTVMIQSAERKTFIVYLFITDLLEGNK